MAEAVNTTRLISGDLIKAFGNKDLLLSVGVIGVLVVLIIPLPVIFLDFLMIVNIMIGLMIILTSIYTKSALEFSIFPTVLLFSTVFRMAVNISSTRLILTQGTSFEGQVVRTFGDFVVGGSYVVGFIVFIIITAAQFLVITKGATRVSEVSARFKLDSLPGKQMAIDADLNAGLITEKEAIERRKHIQEEADFYGNMDGATKFISGDVKLGIVVTLVNIIGGIIVGMVLHGEGLSEAASGYVMLAVGDGLVTQIPSLMVATATGVVVTRSISTTTLGQSLSNQLLTNPKIMVIVGVFIGLIGFVPGFPTWVFLAVGAGTLYLAYRLNALRRAAVMQESRRSQTEGLKEEDEYTPEKMVSLVSVDPLEIELGYALIPLVNNKANGDLLERVKKSRRQVVLDMGVIMPQLRITDNMQLEADEYVIKIHGGEVGRFSIRMNSFLAMNTSNVKHQVNDRPQVNEPVFGLPAYWIADNEKEEFERHGYTIVDGPTIVATHLTEIVKRHASELVGRKEVKELLDNLRKKNASLVEEMDKLNIKLGDVQKVLQELLKEQVSIRNINTILEIICDNASMVGDYETVSEYVRASLRRQICAGVADEGNNLHVIVFSNKLEEQLIGFVSELDKGRMILNLSPDLLKSFVEGIGGAVKEVRAKGYSELLLVDPRLRKPIQQITKQHYPSMKVLSFNEEAEGYHVNNVCVL